MRKINIHLISDSTGETVSSVARATLAQFDGIEVEEHLWPLIRTTKQLDHILTMIEDGDELVMYTLVEKELREHLAGACLEKGITCIPVLARVLSDLSAFFGVKIKQQPGKQHELGEKYFSRVEAINYTLAHDDGQAVWDLDEADVVLIGVSRTSKSPTCVYLAYRGYRAANVPFVSGISFPDEILKLKKPLIIGLTISPDRLIQIRKNRLLALKEFENTSYVDNEEVNKEIGEARKLFAKLKCPVIDVTRRSVEETAANIIQLYQELRGGDQHARTTVTG
ncbi:MAG: kinase/pyrophosphorylase [Alphaproteobacteria bacterium]|nr:kinase/pyrophosphorylase [Alphaproteobacteria bacterium]